jgi:hypothetical protein
VALIAKGDLRYQGYGHKKHPSGALQKNPKRRFAWVALIVAAAYFRTWDLVSDTLECSIYFFDWRLNATT